jgi:hypothetical protein
MDDRTYRPENKPWLQLGAFPEKPIPGSSFGYPFLFDRLAEAAEFAEYNIPHPRFGRKIVKRTAA